MSTYSYCDMRSLGNWNISPPCKLQLIHKQHTEKYCNLQMAQYHLYHKPWKFKSVNQISNLERERITKCKAFLVAKVVETFPYIVVSPITSTSGDLKARKIAMASSASHQKFKSLQ